MNLAIRWKLILGIGLPLLALLGLWLFLDYARLRESAYTETERREREVAERYAASLDGAFRSVAQVSRTLASVFESNASFTEPEIYELLGRNVLADPLVYGSCLALAPGPWPFRSDQVGPTPPSDIPLADRAPRRARADLHAPYVFRGPGSTPAAPNLLRIDIGDSYDYTLPEWDWFHGPARTGLPRWTEPYFDENAGEIAMVTFSQPFFREQAFRGVVTVDIDLEALSKRLRASAAPEAELFLLTRRGTLVAGPSPFKPFKDNIFELAKTLDRPEFKRLGDAMVSGGRGTVPLRDPANDRRLLVFYAPVAYTGWSIAAVVSEDDVMAPVLALLQQRLIGGLLFIAIILAVVLGMGVWIVRPIRRLARAVRGMSLEDPEFGLDPGEPDRPRGADPRGMRSGDEVSELSAAIASMRGQIRAQVEAITRETAAREAVEAELRVARAIQTSLLPTQFPRRPDLIVHGLSEPAKFVGGDFYDIFPSGENTYTLVIADVSGKGVPAAMFMAVTRTLVRDVSALKLTPAECLKRANALLLEANPECMFVSVFLGSYHVPTGRLTYANAGHPSPLIADRAGAVRAVGETTGTVMGAVEDPIITEREVTLPPGATLVMFTDGVPEARAPGGAFYGLDRLQTLLKSEVTAGPEELCKRLLAELITFQPQGPHDDITLLAVHRPG